LCIDRLELQGGGGEKIFNNTSIAKSNTSHVLHAHTRRTAKNKKKGRTAKNEAMKSDVAVEVQRTAPEQQPEGERRRDSNGSQAGMPSGHDANSHDRNEQHFQAGVEKALILQKSGSRTTLAIAFTRYLVAHPLTGQTRV
jgi:hypothetical protein